MTLRERETRLFERWKEERNDTSFLPDGVPDEAVWNEQKVKITFVLKEANWRDGNADLREFLRNGGDWKTWNNVARWAQALLAGGAYPRHVSPADRSCWLSRISFLNLKKAGGGRRASSRELREYAVRDAAFLREQLSLYAPDLVVCCGWGIVAGILYQDVLPKESVSAWKKTANGFDFFCAQIAGKNTPVVSFYHPQRVASHEVFSGWYEDMKKIGDELLGRRDIITETKG